MRLPRIENPLLRRLNRDVFVGIAIALVALRLAGVEPWVQSVDAYAYWQTRFGDMYAGAIAGEIGAYIYPPPFAQVMTPLVALPWQPFIAIWTSILIGAYWYMAREYALVLLLFIPIPFEIVSGNIHLLIALAIVSGFRFSATWAFPLLTKVTPGVGIIWFGLRREWRALLVALAVTGGLALVSVILAPTEWRQWLDVLRSSESAGLAETPGWYLPVPFLARLPIGAIIVAWAAVTGRAWAVPVGAMIALPIVWLNSFSMLVALVPLLRVRASRTGPRPGGA